MNICTIIPARGGSNGIPRKNVALFIVAPAAAEIAAMACQHGAAVARHPEEV